MDEEVYVFPGLSRTVGSMAIQDVLHCLDTNIRGKEVTIFLKIKALRDWYAGRDSN